MKIGQRVVCVKPHSAGVLEVGRIYTVKDIRYTVCCGSMCFDVGLTAPKNAVRCVDHNIRFSEGPVWWVKARLFAPLEEKGETNIEEFINSLQAT